MKIDRVQKLADLINNQKYREMAAKLPIEAWAEDLAKTIANYTEMEVCRVLHKIDDAIAKEQDEHTAEVLAELSLTITRETGNINSDQFNLKTITASEYAQNLKQWRNKVQKELS